MTAAVGVYGVRYMSTMACTDVNGYINFFSPHVYTFNNHERYKQVYVCKNTAKSLKLSLGFT